MVKTKKIKRRTKKTFNRRIKRTNKKMSKRIKRTKKRTNKKVSKRTNKKIQNNRRMKNKRIHKLVRTNAIIPDIQTGGMELELKEDAIEDAKVDASSIVGSSLISDRTKTSYEIDESKALGSGGFAHVYQGTYGGEPVAIKKFKGSEAANLYEIAINGIQLSTIDCPEVPGILSTKLNGFIDTDKASHVIIMDQYPGMELLGYLNTFIKKRSSLSADLINKIASDILLQIICLHDRNYVHRDIKLENIIFDNNSWKSGDKEKILARLIDWDMTGYFMGSGIKGTPAYWSPELAYNVHIDLKPSDMFAFGVCLYILCCQRFPFGSGQPSLGLLKERSSDSMLAFKEGDVLDFQDLIQNLLSADPRKRPTASQALDIIRPPPAVSSVPVPAIDHTKLPAIDHTNLTTSEITKLEIISLLRENMTKIEENLETVASPIIKTLIGIAIKRIRTDIPKVLGDSVGFTDKRREDMKVDIERILALE